MTDIDINATHLNARVRGKKSRLFKRSDLDHLLEQTEVQATIDLLLDSPYKEDMAEALSLHTGAAAVEDAVTRCLMGTLDSLMRIAQDELRVLGRIFITRWDLQTVKGLLRHRHQGLDASAAETVIAPGPTLGGALLRDLAARSSMDALIAGLIAWNKGLCAPLRRVLPEYEQDRNVAVIEDALDRHYFNGNVKTLAGMDSANAEFVRRILRMEIDRINVRVLLAGRLAGDSVQALQPRLLPDGLLSRHSVDAMLNAATAAEVVELLASTRYAELAEQAKPLIATGRMAPVERYFEGQLFRALRRMAREHVLSIAVLLEYCWLLYNEAVNLRVIAMAQERHLPQARVKEELVYV